MSVPPSYPRYDQRAFVLYEASSNPNIEYLRHPSGVIIIRLGDKHECLSKEIQEISFDTSRKFGGNKDRTKQIVTGKSKKGGLKLGPETKLCIIKCSDETTYTIRSGIKATLIEANAKLIANPQLLKTSRIYSGFVAVVIPPAVLNHHRSTIPVELDKVLSVGTELPSTLKLLASKNTTDLENKQDAKNVNEEEVEIEEKRQKLI